MTGHLSVRFPHAAVQLMENFPGIGDGRARQRADAARPLDVARTVLRSATGDHRSGA